MICSFFWTEKDGNIYDGWNKTNSLITPIAATEYIQMGYMNKQKLKVRFNIFMALESLNYLLKIIHSLASMYSN